MAGWMRRFYKIIPPNPPRLLGKGKEGEVKAVTIKSPFFNSRVAAQKTHARLIAKSSTENVHRVIAKNKKVWRDFKKAGLPVAEFYTPVLRKESKHYLTVLAEDFTKKHGELIQIHNNYGEPVLFRELTVAKDSKLLRELAHDLATIDTLRYNTDYLDFWSLYRKPDGSYGRVIADLTELHKVPYVTVLDQHPHVREFLGPKEYALFRAEYQRRWNERRAHLH